MKAKRIPKSVSKYMSDLAKKRDKTKLREHLKKIASKGGKNRWKIREFTASKSRS